MLKDAPIQTRLKSTRAASLSRLEADGTFLTRWVTLQKFVVTMDDDVFNDLQQLARRRKISTYELFRVIIFPDWIEQIAVEEAERPRERPPSYSQ
jgi:hypothetical protein